MFYCIYPQTNQTLIFTEKNSRIKIPYCTAEKMRELYPNGDFVIIGEIGNGTEALVDQDVLLTNAGKAVPIFPRGSLIKPFEWVVGYIAVGENTYVAAVRSIFPSFLRYRKRRRVPVLETQSKDLRKFHADENAQRGAGRKNCRIFRHKTLK